MYPTVRGEGASPEAAAAGTPPGQAAAPAQTSVQKLKSFFESPFPENRAADGPPAEPRRGGRANGRPMSPPGPRRGPLSLAGISWFSGKGGDGPSGGAAAAPQENGNGSAAGGDGRAAGNDERRGGVEPEPDAKGRRPHAAPKGDGSKNVEHAGGAQHAIQVDAPPAYNSASEISPSAGGGRTAAAPSSAVAAPGASRPQPAYQGGVVRGASPLGTIIRIPARREPERELHFGGPIVGAPPATEDIDPFQQPLLGGSRRKAKKPPPPPPFGRLMAGYSLLHGTQIASLDVFRGFAIIGLTLLRDIGPQWPSIDHSPWHGLHLADFFLPFLLFSVGASVALAFKSFPSYSSAMYKALIRAVSLFVLGVFLQGGYYHGVGSLSFGVSLTHLRILGILQRVAVVFFVVALCEVAVAKGPRNAPPKGCLGLLTTFILQWGVIAVIGILFIGFTHFMVVPDWSPAPSPAAQSLLQLPSAAANASSGQTVACGVAGDMSEACNAAGFVDRLVLGADHLLQQPPYAQSEACSSAGGGEAPAWCQAPFEPYGLLSTLSAVLAAFAGLHFGHILTHFKRHSTRLLHAVVYGAVLAVLGWSLQWPLFYALRQWLGGGLPRWLDCPGIPFNRSLFTLSYMLFTTGVACLLSAALYLLVDVVHVRFYTRLFEWVGRNPLFVFVLATSGVFEALLGGFYWKSPSNNLVSFVGRSIAQFIQDEAAATLVGAVAKCVVWSLVAGFFVYHDHIWSF